MKAILKKIYLPLIFITFLVACGTFEIGIENNTIVKTQDITVVDTEAIPTSAITGIDSPAASPTPIPSDEQLITAVIAETLSQPIEQLEIAVTNITGIYAYGFVENGYFLAVKQDDTWQYVHAGQTNPACKDVEPYDFPLQMVPECMDENNQIVVLTGGNGGDIGETLAEYFGVARDELKFTIMQDAGSHIMGYLPGGYFLAAMVDNGWQIVFDGNGTPYCAQVDVHEFPAFIVPECMDANNNLVYRTDSADELPDLQSLDCGPGSPGAIPGTVESVACNIQDGLRSRNISALLGYMEDPFIIGYWLSEGVSYTPEDFLSYLPQLYNFNDPDYTPRLTFTTDRDQFPELDGRPLEGRFGPDVNVVEVIYSQGWGPEGDQEALIYIVQDAAGDFKWRSMLSGDLDVPIP